MTILDTAIIRSQFENKKFNVVYKETIRNYINGTVKCYKPLKIMNGVYFSTYATANLSELYCKTNNIDNKLLTLTTTSLVNVIGIAYKDRQYIKLFENKSVSFPLKSYCLFALRDSFTIGSVFILKKDLVQLLHNKYGISYNLSDFLMSFTVPLLAQLFSTPLHILALDLYQKPNNNNRINSIIKLYPSVCKGRIIRVIPSFCFGSYINDILRSNRYFT